MTRPRDVIDVTEPYLLELEHALPVEHWPAAFGVFVALVYVAFSVVHTTISVFHWVAG